MPRHFAGSGRWTILFHNMTSDTAQKTNASAKKSEHEEALEYLKEQIKPGDTVYTILRHVSKSGMSRLIDLYLIKGNQPFRITCRTAEALRVPYDRRREAVRIGGVGTDVGYATVHNLGCALFNNGYALR